MHTPSSTMTQRITKLVAGLKDTPAQSAMANPSLTLYRQIFDKSADGIGIFDAQGIYVAQNPAHIALLGYTDEELLGNTPALHMSEAMFFVVRQALLKEGHWRGEVLNRRRDGSSVAVELSAFAMRDRMGRPVCFVGVNRDIGPRKEIERALADSHELLQSTLDALSAHIAVLDENGTIIAVNAAWRQFAVDNGFASTFSGLGSNYLDVCDAAVASTAAAVAAEGIREVMSGRQQEFSFEYPFHGVGEPRWLRLKATRFTGQGPARLVVSHEDITERVQAERRRATQYAVASIVAESPSIEEASSRISRAIAEGLGWDLGAIWQTQGEVLRCVGAWHAPQRRLAQLEAGLRSITLAREEGLPGGVWATRKPHWTPFISELETFPFREFAAAAGVHASCAFPILNGEEVIGVMEFYTRDLREPDDDLLALMTALGTQVGQFFVKKRAEDEVMRQKQVAEAANRAKDRFIAVLSHELRTPLTPVLAAVTEVQEDENLPEEYRALLQMVARNVELEARLIDDLLDLTRISQGKVALQIDAVDAHQTLEHALTTCDSDIEKKGLHLEVALNAERPVVRADAIRLQQVFWNVIKNAVKFTPAGGKFSITSRNDDGRLVIEFTDTGIGIREDMLTRIFEPFEQGSVADHRHYGGVGLGLTISKALLESCGGSLEVTSPGEGKGSTFIAKLQTTDAEAAQAADQNGGESPGASRAGLRILLVDDHAQTVSAMKRALERRGHFVSTADCAEAALNVARDASFDLLISDIGLPDRSGLELMRELSASRPIKGIAFSGFGMDEDIDESRRAGFIEHLTKPVNFQRLETVIQRICRE